MTDLLALLLLAGSPGLSCTAIDGDTLRCGSERVRLIGIDAPEQPGHCQYGRRCAPGDPVASTEGLRRLVNGKRVILDRRGTDRHGRTLAFASVNGVDLSCAQLQGGRAIYVERWDIDGRTGRCAR